MAKTIIDFSPALGLIGIFTLYLISVSVLGLEISSDAPHLYVILIWIFVFAYSTFALCTLTKRIVQIDEYVLQKVFKSYKLSDIKSVYLKEYRNIGFMILRLTDNRRIFCTYTKLYDEHEDLKNLFKKENISYKNK